MKLILRSLSTAGIFTAAILAFDGCDLLKPAPYASNVMGSVRPAANLAPEELPPLAKISLPYAMDVAINTTHGDVTNATLEVQNGNLQYSFTIVNAFKETTYVAVDAGNGKVLGVRKKS